MSIPSSKNAFPAFFKKMRFLPSSKMCFLKNGFIVLFHAEWRIFAGIFKKPYPNVEYRKKVCSVI